MKIAAVIVDFDETLCLSEETCFDLENEVLGLMGRPPMSREIHRSTWGQPTFEVIKVRSPGVDVETFCRLQDEQLPRWVAEGRIDAINPLNLATLDTLIEQGKKVFLLTSRNHQEVRHLLAPDHGLAKRIAAFYYHDVMDFHKPDPRAFDLLLKDHRLKRQACVYVGDTPNDAIAAKQANLHFIASVEGGLRPKKDFEGLNVDLFIDHFADLPAAITLLERSIA